MTTDLPVEIVPDTAALAEAGAEWIARAATVAVTARGRFTLAVSGGATPGPMFAALAERPLPWDSIHIFQVDERVAPDGHPDRNANLLTANLIDRVPVSAGNVHLMPVTAADLDAAAGEYALELEAAAGGTIDLVHLGIGEDGHTASWPPGDPVADLNRPDDPDVVVVGPFNGRRRMTLTPRSVNRAALILWEIEGAAKASVVRRLVAADPEIPASRVRRDGAILLATADAAAGLAPE